jgi:hypothetical protein
MQMVKRTVGGFILLILFLWIFAPKQEIYYLLEKNLATKGIVISNEKFKEGLWGIEITNADIYLEGINIAKAASLEMDLFFLYNQLRLSSVTTDKGIHNYAPKSIKNLSVTFSILKPYKIAIEGDGSFGSVTGGLYFDRHKLLLRFKNIKDIQAFKKFLKKDKKGLYYEKSY